MYPSSLYQDKALAGNLDYLYERCFNLLTAQYHMEMSEASLIMTNVDK